MTYFNKKIDTEQIWSFMFEKYLNVENKIWSSLS